MSERNMEFGGGKRKGQDKSVEQIREKMFYELSS